MRCIFLLKNQIFNVHRSCKNHRKKDSCFCASHLKMLEIFASPKNGRRDCVDELSHHLDEYCSGDATRTFCSPKFYMLVLANCLIQNSKELFKSKRNTYEQKQLLMHACLMKCREASGYHDNYIKLIRYACNISEDCCVKKCNTKTCENCALRRAFVCAYAKCYIPGAVANIIAEYSAGALDATTLLCNV